VGSRRNSQTTSRGELVEWRRWRKILERATVWAEDVDEALNGAHAPLIPLSDQFLIEVFAILHTGLPTIQDIGRIRIEDAAPFSRLFVGGSRAPS
jgi:hypothetical protein